MEPDGDADALAARVAELERRQRALEDEVAIRALLADYGARADRGDHDGFVSLFDPDGAIRLLGGDPAGATGDHARWQGSEQLREFIDDPGMHMAIEGRCMHLSGLCAEIRVHGDRAVALSRSLVVLAEDGVLAVYGGGFERWVLGRTPAGWRIVERARAAVGSGAAGDLLAPPDLEDERGGRG